MVHRNGRAPGTFKKKVVKTSSDQNRQLQRLAEKSLGGSNLRQQVKLPPGEDLDEWLAYNCTSASIPQKRNPENYSEQKGREGPTRYFWWRAPIILLSSCSRAPLGAALSPSGMRKRITSYLSLKRTIYMAPLRSFSSSLGSPVLFVTLPRGRKKKKNQTKKTHSLLCPPLSAPSIAQCSTLSTKFKSSTRTLASSAPLNRAPS